MNWIGKITSKLHLSHQTEHEKRMHRCAFTGHRPEKLTCPEFEVKHLLRCAILDAISSGYTVYISGMSRGVDLWAAEIVLDLKKRNKDLKLICAVPYEGFECRWSHEWQNIYHCVLKQADFVYVIAQRYSPDVFMKRNIWMVNHSSRAIAVYNGQPSGTRNTIEYAKQQGVSVYIIEV